MENLYSAGVDGIIIENLVMPFFIKMIFQKNSCSFTSVVQNLEINSDLKVGINV